MREHNRFVLVALAAGLCPALLAASAHAAASFRGLGDLAGGEFASYATAVSGNGEVVVGASHTATGYEAFRWSASTGMQGLGVVSVVESVARGVSFDGSVVIGHCSYPGERGGAFRWTATLGMQPLERLWTGGPSPSAAWAVSSDGSVVAGYGTSTSGPEACKWTETGGIVGLGDLQGGAYSSSAYAISADGAVLVGYGISANGTEATCWTATGGIASLGDLPGGLIQSTAYGASRDGSIVVGQGLSALGGEAFIWTEADGMQTLGYLPGGISKASAISENGSVVVGYAGGAGVTGLFAFVWDQTNGLRDLREILEADCGLDLTGWRLEQANGVSADGLTIVGLGKNPAGHTEAWVATLPEPATLSLLALGGLVLLRRRR